MALARSEKTVEKPFLSLQNLYKSFDKKVALNNFSLDIYKHEIIGLIGHSGSGKSTLLQLIYSKDDLDKGEIRLEDERVKGRTEILVPGDDRIKYVRQNYDLFPDHTVYENIEHQIRFYEQEYIDNRIDKLLRAFNIEEIKNIKAKQISGGEQQRVAICCALADSPKLLMLDEPLAHLDQINAKIIKDYLWNFIRSERITTLFVTHNPLDALSHSTRLAIIKEGSITETGKPQELYNKPKDTYTAELLGSCFKINSSIIPKEHLINKRGSYYFRPEMISIDPTSENIAEVTETVFQGDRQLIKAKIQKSKIEFYSDPSIEIIKKQEINIRIDFSKSIFIKK